MPASVLDAPPDYERATGLHGWRLAGNDLIATAATSGGRSLEVRFTAVTPDIWRVRCAPPGGSFPASLPLVVDHSNATVGLQVAETESGLRVSGPTLELELGREPWCMTFRTGDGQLLCSENPFDVDGLGRLFVRPLGFLPAQDGGVAQVSDSWHLNPDEHLFGLGEKFTPLDKTGQRIVSWTVDAFGSTTERSHKNVPLLISTRGYGLFLNTGNRITYDLGTTSCQSYSIHIDGAYLDLYVIYGPTPAQVLERYTGLTGRAPVPPAWSFGLWLSGSGLYRDRAAIEDLASRLDEHEISCDVIHVDPWWMRWRKYADCEWDETAFPEPAGFIEGLHRQGLKLSLWQHPYISVESDAFAEGQRAGHFVRRPDGEVYVIDYGLSLAPLPGEIPPVPPERTWNARVAMVDLSDSAAAAWYGKLLRSVLDIGVDVFKTDFGEDIPEDARFANGMTGAEMHNLYPLLYNRLVFEVTQEAKGAGLVWSRSGYAGSQRYPTCWSGDPAAEWDSLACTIRGGLSVGMSGIPFWSNDIGGYRGRPSPELYIRWAQFGLLCSHARCHGESEREPWFYGAEATAIFRRYDQLRYRLFPYLYSCAHEAAATGLPVLRAMPLAFPNDPNCYDKDLQYMLGPWLLLAPIYDGTDRRHVYLPAGSWVDYWTGEVIEGLANVSKYAPLDVLPIFVRGGAMIPEMAPVLRIPDGPPEQLIVNIYPHGHSEYRLLEDGGATDFVCDRDASELAFEWSGSMARPMTLRFHVAKPPRRMLVDFGGRLAVERSWQVAGDGALELSVGATQTGRVRTEWARRG